jgi:hypothetical protein
MNGSQSRWQAAALETHRRLPFPVPYADARALSALGIVGVFAVALIAMWNMPGRCQTRPIALAPGSVVEASVDVPASRPCTMTVSVRSTAIRSISIEADPAHGTLVPRGRTGVIYVPAPGYVGDDAFTFALEGEPFQGGGTSLVRVIATVK